MGQDLFHQLLFILQAQIISYSKISGVQRYCSGTDVIDGGTNSKTTVIAWLYEARYWWVQHSNTVWKHLYLFLMAENRYCHVTATLCTPPTNNCGSIQCVFYDDAEGMWIIQVFQWIYTCLFIITSHFSYCELSLIIITLINKLIN